MKKEESHQILTRVDTDAPTTRWITKHALTGGILKYETSISDLGGGRMIRVENSYQCFHKPYWYDTEAEALAHADQLRLKKIASLKKQIERLEALRFLPE